MKFGETIHTEEFSCPVCKTKLDAITNPNRKEADPKPGSVSICLECLSILIIQEDGYEEATSRDIFNFPPELGKEVAKQRRRLQEAKNEKNIRKTI